MPCFFLQTDISFFPDFTHFNLSILFPETLVNTNNGQYISFFSVNNPSTYMYCLVIVYIVGHYQSNNLCKNIIFKFWQSYKKIKIQRQSTIFGKVFTQITKNTKHHYWKSITYISFYEMNFFFFYLNGIICLPDSEESILSKWNNLFTWFWRMG